MQNQTIILAKICEIHLTSNKIELISTERCVETECARFVSDRCERAVYFSARGPSDRKGIAPAVQPHRESSRYGDVFAAIQGRILRRDKAKSPDPHCGAQECRSRRHHLANW
jgi:hypothetical protein